MAGPWDDFAPASSGASAGTAAGSRGAKTYAPLDAIHLIESSGASDARAGIVNPASGARGSMQVRPATAIAPGFGVKPSNGTPQDDARAGRDYYSALEKKYGDSSKAAIAYDMGPGAYDKWQAAGGDASKLPAETRKYLTRFRDLTGSADLYSDKASGGAPWEQFGSSKPDVGAKPQTPPAPAQPPQTLTGFVGGNLAKGVAQTAGPIAQGLQGITDLPARAGNAVMDLLSGKAFRPSGGSVAEGTARGLPGGREGLDVAQGKTFAKGQISAPPQVTQGERGRLPLMADRTPVDEQAQTDALKKAGVITQSAEPRNNLQRYAAAGLQALPSAAIPAGGTNLLGRVGAALGSGVGGEAGRQAGGTTGQVVGSLLGGGLGGIAGAERGIPKPPSEAARASQASGIPLTLGQETGSKALTFSENRLRELFPSAGTAHADELAQVTAGANRVDELASQMSNVKADPELIGNELRTAYKNTVKSIADLRSSQAAADFGAVRTMAAGKPVINYRNTMDTLDKIIAENKNVPAGDAVKIAKQAQSIKDALTTTRAASTILDASGKPAVSAATGAATHTIEDAMKTRSAWGKAAARTGNIFSDIDPNANQVLAKRLFAAVNKDFDAASTAETPVAQALRKANQNYAKASQSIDFIKKSALGKLLGEDVTDAAFSGQTASTKAPELIAKRYLSMNPSEARSVTAILRQHDPDVLNDVKAFVLRNGLDAARNDAPGAPPISFAKFRKEIDRVQPKLEEMGFSRKEIADIKDVTDTMARAGDKTGANASKTTGAAHMLSIPALAVTHPLAAVFAVVTPYAASRALLTQGGRDLLRTAYSASAPAARAAATGALRSQYAQQGQQPQSQSQQAGQQGQLAAPPNTTPNPFN